MSIPGFDPLDSVVAGIGRDCTNKSNVIKYLERYRVESNSLGFLPPRTSQMEAIYKSASHVARYLNLGLNSKLFWRRKANLRRAMFIWLSESSALVPGFTDDPNHVFTEDEDVAHDLLKCSFRGAMRLIKERKVDEGTTVLRLGLSLASQVWKNYDR